MRTILFFLLIPFYLSAAKYNIVFVHIGPKFPDYLETALEQANLFNPECDLYLIGNETTLKSLRPKCKVKLISCESLPKEKIHLEFIQRSRLDAQFKGGLFRYATERFFYLYELMEKYKLSNVFHLETDVMLYADLAPMLPIFQKHYKGIGATFDNDARCIPGFVYIQNKTALYDMVKVIVKQAALGKNDMFSIGFFRKISDRSRIDSLPIVSDSYARQHPLESLTHLKTSNPENYFNHFDEFQSIFDAAAIGQYLGGIDPIHGVVTQFVNESALFNPSYMEYVWKPDEKNRLVPYAVLGSEEVRINNLHIHCKNLKKFVSKP